MPIRNCALACLLLITSASPALAVNGPWTLLEPGVTSAHLSAVATNGSLDVAIGGANAILTSSDGIHWTPVYTGYEAVDNDLIAVVWTGNAFVAVGNKGLALSSSDGVHWTGATPQASEIGLFPSFGGLVAGGGHAVALGSAGPDNAVWNGSVWNLAADAGSKFAVIAWAGGTFYAGIGEGFDPPYISSDGLSWTKTTTYPGTGGCQLASSGTTLLAYDGNSHIYSTTDGMHWTDLGIPPNAPPCPSGKELQWIGNEFVLLTGGVAYYSSPDGVAWTSHTQASSAAGIDSMVWDGTHYIAVGANSEIAYSTDGDTWNAAQQRLTTASFQSLVWTGSTYVGSVLGNGPTSSLLVGSGTSWTPVAVDVRAVQLANGKIYGFGLSGNMVSTDGIHWNAVTGLTSNYLTVAGDGASGLVMLGVTNLSGPPDFAAVSTDGGSTWAQSTLSFTRPVVKLIYANGGYIGITQDSVIASTNGTTWSETPVGSFEGLNDIVYGDGMYVVAGGAGDMFTSTDGVHWATHAALLTTPHATVPEFTAVAWDGKEFMAASIGNTLDPGIGVLPVQSSIWVSDDGQTWYPEVPLPGFEATAMATGTNQILLGDATGSIAVSTPGGGDLPVAANITSNITVGGVPLITLSATDPSGRPLLYQFGAGTSQDDTMGAYLLFPGDPGVLLRPSSVSAPGSSSAEYFVSNGIVYSAPATLTVTVTSASSGGGTGGGGGNNGSGSGTGGSKGGGGGTGIWTLAALAFAGMRRNRSRRISWK